MRDESKHEKKEREGKVLEEESEEERRERSTKEGRRNVAASARSELLLSPCGRDW